MYDSIENIMTVPLPTGTVTLNGFDGRIEKFYEVKSLTDVSVEKFTLDNPDKLIIVYLYSPNNPYWSNTVLDSDTFAAREVNFIRVAALELNDEEKEIVFKNYSSKLKNRKYLLIGS